MNKLAQLQLAKELLAQEYLQKQAALDQLAKNLPLYARLFKKDITPAAFRVKPEVIGRYNRLAEKAPYFAGENSVAATMYDALKVPVSIPTKSNILTALGSGVLGTGAGIGGYYLLNR